MKTATVVIGSQFGDEGKGLLTDYHAHRLGGRSAIVCRFNGGSQAGHTVTTPEGTRHVFSHFGSGSLAGAPTFLSRFFICNPLIWRKEELELRPSSPVLYVDREAMLTTPFDMMINQFAELARGGNRHGSCGLGINETQTRDDAGFGSDISIISNRGMLRDYLEDIRLSYVPDRLDRLGLVLTEEQRTLLNSPAVIDQYLDACDKMLASVTLCDADVMADRAIVFEGAQGLLLDQSHRFFPHVTRSNTGLTNVLDIAEYIGIEHLDVNYVTRTYLTRHGDGPLPTHDPDMRFEDETNCPNAWQGTMRFGELDIDLMSEAIRKDRQLAKGYVDIDPVLAFTWCDKHTLTDSSMTEIANRCRIRSVVTSWDKTRDGISYSMRRTKLSA